MEKTRLTEFELTTIKCLFHKYFLPKDELWVFGSKADLNKKGGDLDLYIETNVDSAADAIKRKSNFLWDLTTKIGEQKIDLVLNLLKFPHPIPIHNIAKEKGVKIA